MIIFYLSFHRPQQTSPGGSVSSGGTQRPNYPVAHAHPATVNSHSDHKSMHPHNRQQYFQLPDHPQAYRPPVPIITLQPDQNLNSIHPHHHPNSRASSSSGGTTAHNSGSGSVTGHSHTNGPQQGNGSTGSGNNNPKQEQRLTHEQVSSY